MIRPVLFILSMLFLTASCSKSPDRFADALNSFQLEEGLRIDLIAAEPLVVDPVALAFDEDRRMYVVEHRGYPGPMDEGAPTELGRVARLEDTDGDGRYDHRTEFATGFTYPNGVLPWRGGVFVTCAPDIFYLKDTNDDGVADLRKVVLTGFNDTKTTQIRMSSPTMGIDGWVYLAGGLNGGSVTSPEHPDQAAVSYTSADGRFHPDTFEFQVTGGKSQFGLTFDSFGRRFGSSNRHPVQHIVLEPWHLLRNQHLTYTESIENVSKVESEARVFPISGADITADFIPSLIGRSHTGTFTSACGLLVFNGTGLTPAHGGNVFICEPAQNLVQRQEVRPEMVSFCSDLPYQDREFLSSTDTWFNPVFLQHGPNGALYLADMHRKVIDHPSYVPEESRSLLDFKSGKDKGRIYRITRENLPIPTSDNSTLNPTAPTLKMVMDLKSSEEWVRATAHRLMLERAEMKSVPLLKECAVEAPLGESRVRALWLLSSLGALDATTVKAALLDKNPGVREQAILLSENLCNTHPELIDALILASDDSVARVRFNCALVLGSLQDSKVIPAMAKIAANDGANKWSRAAILSGIGTHLSEFLEAFRRQHTTDSASFTAVMQDLGRLFGNGALINDCRTLLQELIYAGTNDWSIATALGLVEGISGRPGFTTTSEDPLVALLGTHPSKADRLALDQFISQAATMAGNASKQTHLRIKAIALLGYTNFDRTGSLLYELLGSQNAPELQVEAVAALARQNDPRGAEMLTKKETWSSFTPGVRLAVVGALVSQSAIIHALFHAIEQGVIATTDISSVDRQRLINSTDPNINTQAKVLFKDLEEGGRMQVYQEYREHINLKADANLGKIVFMKTCAACHSYGGVGGNVGPDLTGVNNQPIDALLLHTLVPNYEVYPTYQAISVETTDGRSFSGRLIAETENSLTLRTALGTDESILRINILSLTNTGRSMMPDGLEQGMSKNELADLMAYLKSGVESTGGLGNTKD